jgi:hypothetical protein
MDSLKPAQFTLRIVTQRLVMGFIEGFKHLLRRYKFIRLLFGS